MAVGTEIFDRTTPSPPAPADGGRALLRRIALGTALTDVVSLVAAMVLAYQVRFGLDSLSLGYGLLMSGMPAAWLIVFSSFRLYGARHYAPEEEARRIWTAVIFGVVVMVLVSYWAKAEFSRLWLGLTSLFALAGEIATRTAWRRYRARHEAEGAIALRTLIVGANEEAARLSETLRAGTGFAPLGYVSVAPATPSPNGLPVVGDLASLERTMAQSRVQALVVAASAIDARAVCDVAAAARRAGIEMRISSRLPEVLTTRLGVHRVGDATMISVMSPRLTTAQRALKRTFDVVVGSVLLLVTSPLWVVAAVAIWLHSRGPVLYRQERVTVRGRRFAMLKFRTMRGDRVAGFDAAAPYAKLDHDPRVTRVGRFLRRFSLDELPQLVNVVRGDMSLVGPRPLPVEQVLANWQLLAGRDEVPAGMTGWWQVSGRSDVPPDEAARLDLFYVENWSIAYDLYILARTLGVVLTGRGAR